MTRQCTLGSLLALLVACASGQSTTGTPPATRTPALEASAPAPAAVTAPGVDQSEASPPTAAATTVAVRSEPPQPAAAEVVAARPAPPPIAAAAAASATAPRARTPAQPATPALASPTRAAARTGPASPPLAASPNPAATKSAATTGKVTIRLANLKDDAGQVLAALFRTPEGFPNQPSKAFARKFVKIHGRQVQLVFEDVPPGTFAISLYHDEDGDSKMATGLFGIPEEAYGMSRDAKANFGPPTFEDARLSLAAGEDKRLLIHLNY